MHVRDVPILTPCGADWSTMTAEGARARLCAACERTVHDLSAMGEGEVRALLADGPACVRYLHDAHGNILSGAPPRAKIVPAAALLSKVMRNKLFAAAAVAALPLVFEACGGAAGEGRPALEFSGPDGGAPDGGDGGANRPRVPAAPAVGDSGAVDPNEPDAG